jgi:hypothetical protein
MSQPSTSRWCLLLAAVVLLSAFAYASRRAAAADPMPRVRVSDDGRSFVLADTGRRFVPWGFNYDHDADDRLIEDYWHDEWDRVEQDFAEMKDLGANVVRVHLQFGKFMDDSRTPNERSLEQLARLLRLAERTGLYLDLTGLGCYHKKDVPGWYDRLDEAGRWAAQARFWEAVASRGAGSPAVLCYNLMNEPVVPGRGDRREDWLGPALAGKHFVEFITRELGDRERHEVARQWIGRLAAAVRKHDREALVTVGLVSWSLDRPGLTSGFIPEKIAGELDFLTVHLYPERGKLDEAIDTLKGFNVGKPVLVEETFPLYCTAEELGEFFDRSREHAAGWIGFYWGKTLDEYRRGTTLRDAVMRSWLELFLEKSPAMLAGPDR